MRCLVVGIKDNRKEGKLTLPDYGYRMTLTLHVIG